MPGPYMEAGAQADRHTVQAYIHKPAEQQSERQTETEAHYIHDFALNFPFKLRPA